MCIETYYSYGRKRDFVFRAQLRTSTLAVISVLVVYFNQGKKFHPKIKSRSSKSKVGNKFGTPTKRVAKLFCVTEINIFFFEYCTTYFSIHVIRPGNINV